MSADEFLTVDGRPTVRVERRYPAPDRQGVARCHDARAPRAVVPEPGRARPATRRRDAVRGIRRRRRSDGHGRGRRCATTAHVQRGAPTG